MTRTVFTSLFCLLAVLAHPGSEALGQDLSLYDIQYTTDPGGDSPQTGNIVSCQGGIVTHVFFGNRCRIFIQDPQYPQWGAIQVKDWTDGGLLAHAVQIGDWLSLDNTLVDGRGIQGRDVSAV